MSGSASVSPAPLNGTVFAIYSATPLVHIKFAYTAQDEPESTKQKIQPDLVERIGLRYINRIACINHSHVSELLQPEIVGIAHDNLGDHLVSTFSETRFIISNTITVDGKWGLLPKGQSYDPTVLLPIDEQSWVLDLDAISEDSFDFTADTIAPIVGKLADTDYRLFRFAVTDSFLQEYGGTP